ncbi:MAG: YidC/Oxa1 family membrane protein insertase [Deinococcales bacterium]
MALFAKQQQGQDLRGNYSLDNNYNLIPQEAQIPGGALLVNGEYQRPSNPSPSSWQYEDKDTLLGEFDFDLANMRVFKQIRVKSTDNTFQVDMRFEPLAAISDANTEADAEIATTTETATTTATTTATETPPNTSISVFYAFPGIARNQNPIIKIGQGNTATENPLQNQAVPSVNYASFQSAPVRGVALVMTPNEADISKISGLSLGNNRIAFQKVLKLVSGANSLSVRTYGCPNELVRFYQEDYYELPKLFKANIFGTLSLAIINILESIHRVIPVWGVAIILLTLFFRLLIWPLIATQTKSMVAMQKLQPKIQALQKKYKDDRQKLTEETMKLYQQEKVNPAGGCLPIFLQMPLFFILWRVFMNFEFNEGFLWVPDLGLADPTYILPILYVGIMVAQAFLSAKGNKQMLQQQLMMNVIFAVILFSFPAGVLLYWIVSMSVQVGQYYLIQRQMQVA